MAIRQLFYVTQDSLVIWSARYSGISQEDSFQSTDDGFRQFADYLRRAPQQLSVMLVDVIEEEFAIESMPKLGRRDRNALIERKLQRKFPRTPYRIGVCQRGSDGEEGGVDVLFSAISNPELLEPWLKIISQSRTPLSGVHSVSMLASNLLGKLRKPAANALFLTPHQGSRLRQTYLSSGSLKSSRLSQPPPLAAGEYGSFIFTEIVRSRRYHERMRLLGAGDPLDVYIIADGDLAESITESCETVTELRLHFIDPGDASKSLNVSTSINPNHCEALYLAMCARTRPKHDYAPKEETAYSRMLMVRHAAMATAVSASIVCSVLTGIYLMDGLQLRGASRLVESQIRQMEETYRRENKKFRPIRADSHEMKLAVDAGDYILENKLPVPWVLQQLGLVLGNHPDIHIEELNWRIEAAGAQSQQENRSVQGNAVMPVTIVEIAAVRAELAGQIRPYDGNLREAFRKIDALIESLQADTAFNSVVAIQFPINASPASSLSGGVSNKSDKPMAQFRLNLTLRVDREQT